MTSTRVLLLPGWLGSDGGHWQTRWEQGQGFERLQQDDWAWPRRGDWMARLEDALLADGRPTLLVAHSLGCHLVAAWAGHSSHTARVAAALLVAPPDLDRAGLPPQLASWRPRRDRAPHVAALPFASTAVLSTDDPYCSAQRGRQYAATWGSECVVPGPLGHLNADSGLGDWPAGLELLRALQRRAGAA
jgi:hypothetical protein